MCNTRKDPESERVTWDNLETNPITVKPETASHAAEQLSWVPLPSCSPLECPFPVNFSLLCQHTCLLEQFLSVRQEPPLRPWKGPVFLQQQSYHAMQPQAQRADTQACCALIHRCHRAHDKTRLNRLAPRQLAKSGWKVIALSLIYPCFISTWYLAKMLPAASWEISSINKPEPTLTWSRKHVCTDESWRDPTVTIASSPRQGFRPNEGFVLG